MVFRNRTVLAYRKSEGVSPASPLWNFDCAAIENDEIITFHHLRLPPSYQNAIRYLITALVLVPTNKLFQFVDWADGTI